MIERPRFSSFIQYEGGRRIPVTTILVHKFVVMQNEYVIPPHVQF